MLETEANILETWCTTCGTANSLTALPYLGACESWEFVTSLGSQCLCTCPGFRAECYLLVLQLGIQHFCVMGNTVKYLEYNSESCLCDFRAQVLFLEVICVPGGAPTEGPGPFVHLSPKCRSSELLPWCCWAAVVLMACGSSVYSRWILW